MREGEAGDAGGGDGEAGAGRRVGPALLHAPRRRRRGEVLRGVKGGPGTEEVTRHLGQERVWGEVVVPLEAST